MKKSNQVNMKVVQDPRGASDLLDPLRLKILEGLREPGSASGIARQLRLPRQKVNYHLRELEKHGLLEEVEERRKGNCVERFVQATARSYVINPEALGQLSTSPDEIQDQFSSAYLLAVAVQAIRDLSFLRSKSQQEGKKLATLTLQGEIAFASAEDRSAFARELSNDVARLVARYHTERGAGRRFRFIIGAYPSISRNSKNLKRRSNDTRR